jgi:hypothetical protein
VGSGKDWLKRKPFRQPDDASGNHMLTNEEAEKLKRRLVRQKERDLELADREARGRAAALRSAKSQKRAKDKQKVQQKAVADAAVAAGKTPKSKAKKRSVFAVLSGAFETNRRKF